MISFGLLGLRDFMDYFSLERWEMGCLGSIRLRLTLDYTKLPTASVKIKNTKCPKLREEIEAIIASPHILKFVQFHNPLAWTIHNLIAKILNWINFVSRPWWRLINEMWWLSDADHHLAFRIWSSRISSSSLCRNPTSGYRYAFSPKYASNQMRVPP